MKNYLRTISIILACTMLTFSFSGCIGSTATAPGGTKPSAPAPVASPVEGQIILRFASNMKALELTKPGAGMALQNFIDNIEKRTEGKYKIQIFLDSQLGSTAEQVLGGAQNGAFEMLNYALGSWGEYTDAFMPMNIPYLFSDSDTVYQVVDGPIGARMKEDALEDTQLMPLAFLDIGFRHITNSKREVKTPDDIKGLKIRTMTDPYQIAAMEAIGAACTPISFSELFTALQQKLVDGQENPIANIVNSKLFEVQKYMTTTKHNYTFTTIAISKAAFDKFPADVQKIFLEEAHIAEITAREGLLKQEEEDLKMLKEKITIYNPTDDELQMFQDKAKVSWKAIEEAIGSEYFNEILAEVDRSEKSKR